MQKGRMFCSCHYTNMRLKNQCFSGLLKTMRAFSCKWIQFCIKFHKFSKRILLKKKKKRLCWTLFGSLEFSWVSIYKLLKLLTPGFRELIPFSLTEPFKLDEKHLWAVIFWSLSGWSLGFGWNTQGQSELSLGYYSIVWAVCFGLLSSWKVNHHCSLRSLLWTLE